MEFFTLEQLREKEWVISWSGGKDSTATVILCHKYGIPIKKIIYVRMMWDEKLPATLPVMTDFVDRAKAVFESWGYPVEIVKGNKTAMDIANKIYFKSVDERKNGSYYGASQFIRGTCKFQGVKPSTVNSLMLLDDFELVGYAVDEEDRIHRLTDKKQSVMCTLGVTEAEAFEICREADLLSPLYDMSISRDGCWFCPNAGVKERAILKEQYPELVEKIKGLIEMCSFDLSGLASRNHWIEDYIKGKL